VGLVGWFCVVGFLLGGSFFWFLFGYLIFGGGGGVEGVWFFLGGCVFFGGFGPRRVGGRSTHPPRNSTSCTRLRVLKIPLPKHVRKRGLAEGKDGCGPACALQNTPRDNPTARLTAAPQTCLARCGCLARNA